MTDDTLRQLEILIPRGRLTDEDGAKYNNDTIWSLIHQYAHRYAEEIIGQDIPQYFERPDNRTSKGIWYESQQSLVDEQRALNNKRGGKLV